MASSTDKNTVNIVLRTKNRPVFVARALADISAQTSSAWVLTIVNDGGDSAVLEAVVQESAQRFRDRITIVHLDETLGRAAAANHGVNARPSAQYFVLHDDDDTWEPEFLARTTHWLDEHPEAAAVAVPTRIIYERIAGDRILETRRRPWLPEMRSVSLIDFLQFNRCVPISVLYRRTSVEHVGGFNDQVELTEDWDLNVRLLARQMPFGFLAGEILANWHQRPGVHGDSGNSIVALAGLHQEFDRMVRDKNLGEYVAEHGLALPLLIGEYSRQIETRLERIERMLADSPLRLPAGSFGSC